MPRSKRAKVVSLTKATPKKAKEFRQGKVELLRDAVEEYENVFVFSFTNMRESKLKEVRMDWKESRIYLGKNRVAQVALGRTEEEEIRDNIRFVSERLTGDVGLIFTNREKDDVVKYFGSFSHPDYAKAGMIPQKDVLLKPGKLSFPVGMLDQLRKLGMVVEVDDTKVMLRDDYVAAKKGLALTPEQAKALVHLDKKIANFTIKLECMWSNGVFETL